MAEKQVDLLKMEQFAALGLNIEQIANNLGMSASTFNKRCKEDPSIRERLNIARSQAVAVVANKLYDACVEGDMRAIQFYLRTVGGFKETVVNEHTGKDGEPIKTQNSVDLSNVSTEDLLLIRSKLYGNPDATERD